MSEKRFRYDKVHGDQSGVTDPLPVAASEVFYDRSGKWVKRDGSNRLTKAGSGDTEIIGWALTGELTASATAGNTRLPIDKSYESWFEMPYDDTTLTRAQLDALVGETCDLITTSNIQYADVGESNEDVIEIMGYDYNRQTVFVRRNPNKLATGVV